jgi:hypothetical protein
MVATKRPRMVPKKLSELGRLRIGERVPNKSGTGTHPAKLANFRLTSANGSLLSFAAERYGGTVEPWDDAWAPKDEHGRPTQFELYTTVNAIEVLIPTFSAISLSFERWSASGCQQRCTGEVILECPLEEALIGQTCTCPADDQERADLAQDGKACARILRLNVLLHELPGVGVWRLETKGFYATAELMGTLDMLQMAGHEHEIIEATLRLEQRSVKRVGKGEGKGTLQFAVPVLWPKTTPRQLLTGAAHVLLAPLPALPPAPLEETVALLYGDRDTQPAGEDGAVYLARIEAAILAQPGGEVEPWMKWAEGRFKKPRTAFTVEDYVNFLQAIIATAELRAQKTHAEAQASPAEATSAQQESTASPDTQEGTAGASWGPENPELFAQEERAEEYGE